VRAKVTKLPEKFMLCFLEEEVFPIFSTKDAKKLAMASP
jgi:hypothetical protein